VRVDLLNEDLLLKVFLLLVPQELELFLGEPEDFSLLTMAGDPS